jgi:hypothetical protein
LIAKRRNRRRTLINNGTMKISELIKKLESLKEKHGDNNLRFTVKDVYSTYGEEMITLIKCGEETNLPSDWQDVSTNGNMSTINFHLLEYDGKKPKITFRK